MRVIGTHAIRQSIHSKSKGVLYVVKNNSHLKEYTDRIAHTGASITVTLCTHLEMKEKKVKQGALLILTAGGEEKHVLRLNEWLQSTLASNRLCILVLDHIHDVQNLGALFRSALLFDVDLIISPTLRSAAENEFAFKASSGALGIVPHCKVVNITQSIALLKKHNVWTYALDMRGEDISSYDIPSRIAFVVGNEEKGISTSVIKESDGILSIPMTERCSDVDSFNVSVSAAIACYEYIKHHKLRNIHPA